MSDMSVDMLVVIYHGSYNKECPGNGCLTFLIPKTIEGRAVGKQNF